MIDLPKIKAHVVEQIKQMASNAKVELAQVSSEEMARRITACRACPHLVREPFDRCLKMNCWCPVVTKLSFQRAHCPDNPPRW